MDQANLRDMYRICGGDYAEKMSLLMDHTAHPGNVADHLAKINYRIHTDAIKENLIPPELSARQISLVYANELDV